MAAGSTKRKKFHDKDKYYRLAKEQGLRSRAAFKLTQINRKFPVLEKCQSAVLDLCAAPGGWTQIARRTCPNDVLIVAVDILPIRSVPHVTTLLGDITTDKCRADIKRALQGRSVDVVLHDGAPNIGADYAKDAYEQNEISLYALRCATQHLQAGGTFITKIYRSRDYASYHWVLQQLFENVSALKPKASRAQSAEIFLIAQQYKAPSKLDPKFLDPKHVFASVEGDSSGGGNLNATALSVFNKNFDTKKQRQRQGYDMEHYDATMRHITSVHDFVASETMKDAIQILSSSTGMTFTCEQCKDVSGASVSDAADETKKCSCPFYLHHPLTTSEIKESVIDLQVLNKKDFKVLLTWRTNMQEALQAAKERQKEGTRGKSDTAAMDHDVESDEASDDDDSEKEEQAISGEIAKIRERRMREAKRRKKKERALAGKRRRHAAMGMDLNAIDVPEHDQIFSLATLTSHGHLEAVSEVNLDQVTDEQVFGDSDDDIIVGGDDNDSDDDSKADELALLKREKELDSAYEMYMQTTRNSAATSESKMAKRSKKVQRLKLAMEVDEDQEMALSAPSGIDHDAKTYARMLQGPDDSADEDDDALSEDDEDGFDAAPMTPEEYAAEQSRVKKRKVCESNPLIHKFAEEPTSTKTARWFSNPLFQTIGQAAETATTRRQTTKNAHLHDDSSDDSNDEGARRHSGSKKVGLSAEDVLASIPKTDKEKRHERRMKAKEREERRMAKKARHLDEEEREFQLAPAADDEASLNEVDRRYEHLSEAQQKKIKEANELIKAGLGGKGIGQVESKDPDMEIVPQVVEMDRPLPVMDARKYDSDHEDYDSDDYARTLALGTMLLRRSKEKAFVDASYNRYAWNDPEELPEWFVDDENKHYRPQLPIPPALLAKMKEKMIALSQKPIQKVAEARARKNRRAKTKLAAAKKQAEGIANSSELSDAMKLKAISKALRGKEVKRPSKTYVVAKKGRGSSTSKAGTKQVDKRMKSDKRAATKIQKKAKHGKQNGMTGSKKRRHHS
ncbi:AdoMet-dependent rRNA methyltransferase spb1 [Mayamaea pseudoterrestris]|nr:AdoMet-dependent rRNA methyltransferase spb1 [Mayamaea pseudoterrestris]